MIQTCHFWNPESRQSKTSHSKCEQNASKFVRIKHTGRLCPLCPSCLDTFESANKALVDEVKKGVPGLGEYSIVSLSDGADEFSRQPPRQTEQEIQDRTAKAKELADDAMKKNEQTD